MSTVSAPTKPQTEKPEEGADKRAAQTHTALEEDDEFEEFPVQGTFSFTFLQKGSDANNKPYHFVDWPLNWLRRSDWDDSATELAHLGGAAPGAAKSGGNKLWEENWDDDDVEDNFSRNLR